MKIYLASPFFNEKEIGIYNCIIKKLREKYEVFVPREHKIENEWDISNEEWGKAVFDMDVAGIDECDIVVALNWGLYSDTGTAWECGYAFAKKIPVINILCNKESKEYSLMMINGAKEVRNLEDVLFDIQTLITINQK